MIPADRPQAFPKQGPERVRERKIRKDFTVEEPLLLVALQTQRAEDPSRFINHDLKLGQPLFERSGVEPLSLPKRAERREIIQRRPTGLELRSRHASSVEELSAPRKAPRPRPMHFN